MSNVGVISQETALSYCLTGPILRSTGVNYDVRKAFPYLVYDQMDFEVPVGSKGDNYDRFVCRMREIEQSMRIVEQALEKLPVGPVWIDDPRFVLPEKEKVYGSIEGLMHHFKIIMEGIKVPPGETYFAVEGRQWRAGFLYCQRRRRPALSAARAAALFHRHGRVSRDDQRLYDRRHRSDLRHGQYDRRRV